MVCRAARCKRAGGRSVGGCRGWVGPNRRKKQHSGPCVCAARACNGRELPAAASERIGSSSGGRYYCVCVFVIVAVVRRQSSVRRHRRAACTVEFDEYIDDEPWRAAAAATTRQRAPPQHWPRPLCPVHSPYSRVPPPLSASAVDVMAATGSSAAASSYRNNAADFQHHHGGGRHHHQRHQLSYSHNYEPPPPSVRYRTTTPPPPDAVHRHPYWDTVVPPLPPSLYQRNAVAYNSAKAPYHHRSYHVSSMKFRVVDSSCSSRVLSKTRSLKTVHHLYQKPSKITEALLNAVEEMCSPLNSFVENCRTNTIFVISGRESITCE